MNEYLRFPSKWASIERNATYIQKYLGLFEVSVTPVINAYNALSIVDLFRWAEQRSYRSFISLGRGIEQMDLRRLPPEALADVRKRWFAYVDEQDARSHNLSDDDRTNARKLRAQMESIFAELADPEVVHKNRATFSDFMKFTNDMDSSRKQCFATVSPETYRYFIAHYGAWKSDTEFLGTSPAHTTPVLSAVPDMVTALDRHKVGDLATAEFLYRCALEKAPEEVAPRFMLALLLFQKSPVKHRDEVEKHLNAVIGSTVANAELRHGAASVLKALPPQPPAA